MCIQQVHLLILSMTMQSNCQRKQMNTYGSPLCREFAVKTAWIWFFSKLCSG